MFGPAPGGTSVSSSPTATGGNAGNNSVNNVGSGGFGDLNNLLNLFAGPSENGGYLSDAPEISLISRQTNSMLMPILMVAGVGLLAWLALRK